MGSTPSQINDQSQLPSSNAPSQLVEFSWGEGGSSVFFCGSFNHWRERIPMQQVQPGVWVGTRELQPGTYQFKFVVDGQWRCSSGYQNVRDPNGNMNNQIVVSEKDQALVPKNQENDPQRQQMQQIEQMFTTMIPENPFTIWTSFPTELPRQLVKTPLNTNITNDAYQPSILLPLPDHVVLTHFFKQKKRKNFVVTASTARYRSKYVTIVLYISTEVESSNHIDELADIYHTTLNQLQEIQ
ncbi:5'-AMP-activated protein kinase, beta subunit [Spironucleus salmonicida]|uniref:5'-AMP-activated protein kinase, beta subunit n=1 Tax=Spironucleus salmonicida TaxID=348837 RepID=V6M7F5_9EUKA|nr:5'-AMP-activated protein kinase, beta subunit [Spironucleus salmonicida]|eukprot:EST49374.1 5'-AMP-activated protein kinase, beta subunit [Spironucleus salmonicida]